MDVNSQTWPKSHFRKGVNEEPNPSDRSNYLENGIKRKKKTYMKKINYFSITIWEIAIMLTVSGRIMEKNKSYKPFVFLQMIELQSNIPRSQVRSYNSFILLVLLFNSAHAMFMLSPFTWLCPRPARACPT